MRRKEREKIHLIFLTAKYKNVFCVAKIAENFIDKFLIVRYRHESY